MKSYLIITTLLVSSGTQASLLNSGKISNERYSITIPFRLVDNAMIISIPIKGNNYNFMFDTGAPSALSNKVIKELGLKDRKITMNLHDISGEIRKAKLYDGPNLQIGNVSFNDFTFSDLDTFKDFPMSCFKLDGILGYNLLRHSTVYLDFQAKKIILSDAYRGNPITEGYTPVGFDFYNTEAPQVAIFHDFGDLLLGIDTGKNRGITFRHPKISTVLDNLGYKSDRTYKIDRVGMYGLKAYDVKDYTISNMRIGRIKLDNNQVSVESRDGESLMGVGFMSRFKIIIDFPSRVIWFKPIGKNEQPAHSKRYGFTLDLTKNKKLIASNVEKEKQPQQSSLKNGDQIISINGFKHATFSQDDYCDIFLNESSDIFIGGKESIYLTVLRDGKSKNIKIPYKQKD